MPDAPPQPADRSARRLVVAGACLAVTPFVLAEVNYPFLAPVTQLAIVAMLCLVICFLGARRGEGEEPASGRSRALRRMARAIDVLLAVATVGVFAYVVVQTEPLFRGWWIGGMSLGDRAGVESGSDIVVGVVGLVLVLEATRRTVGNALPLLSLAFVAYGMAGPHLPGWLLPHRGYGVDRLVAQAFLQSQGVFGVALSVMFTYVILFVVFGALLEATGATPYVIAASRRLLGGSAGGPAKVAVVSSGLLGSLSGSAVANTATTGVFTIPLMRSAGFSPRVAAGVEAAASSGGALVPPVMGAAAYMMLEIVEPPVTYLEIVKAALIPACLYYLSLLLVVHWHAKLLASRGATGSGPGLEPSAAAPPPRPTAEIPSGSLWRFEAVVLVGALGGLMALLLAGFSVPRSVSLAAALVVVLAALNGRTRLGWRRFLAALSGGAEASVPLVAAAACVGIVIGVVTLTGAGTRLPAIILPMAEANLLAALGVLMVSSIVLGMGLPSSVCYLLLATFIGPALGGLPVVPLAAHLFIFYFAMMSMVTPPVALAAYAASSIAGSEMLSTSTTAFRFALAGFTLPYLFVFRPALLMLAPGGGPAGALDVVLALLLSALGIAPLAAAIAGYLFAPLPMASRGLLVVAATLALVSPAATGDVHQMLSVPGAVGIALFVAVGVWQWRRREGRT